MFVDDTDSEEQTDDDDNIDYEEAKYHKDATEQEQEEILDERARREMALNSLLAHCGSQLASSFREQRTRQTQVPEHHADIASAMFISKPFAESQ